MEERLKITIYDIAKEAGVSSATVSRVLSGHPHVSEKTSEKVRRIVDKYQFRPSSVARGLYQRTSRSIGIILPGVVNPYYAALFTAAYQEAQSNGYATLVYQTSPTEKLDTSFANQLIERRLDGVLMLGGAVESPELLAYVAPALNLIQQHMPLVTICPPIPGVDCINFGSDLTASVRQSVHHLYGLGHKRIAFLGGSAESRSAGERERGFAEVMQKLGLECAYQHETGHTPEAGEIGIAKLLAGLSAVEVPAESLHGAVSSNSRRQKDGMDVEAWPTAIITINDLVALGAMRQLKRMGLRIPEDMAVIGCDNQFFSPYTDPPLTTVDNHPAELGRIALGQLLSVIASGGGKQPFSQVRESSLVVRESCGVHLGRRRFD